MTSHKAVFSGSTKVVLCAAAAVILSIPAEAQYEERFSLAGSGEPGVNITDAYGENLRIRRDQDEDGWPDVIDNCRTVHGFKDGYNNERKLSNEPLASLELLKSLARALKGVCGIGRQL
jgi:hypothetical protein